MIRLQNEERKNKFREIKIKIVIKNKFVLPLYLINVSLRI